MTPHFLVWTCDTCDQEFKQKHCFRNGKYCAISTTLLTGQEIIMEDLRQKCIYNQAYSNKRTQSLFWHYITVMHDECESNLNEDCSKYAHEQIQNLDWEAT